MSARPRPFDDAEYAARRAALGAAAASCGAAVVVVLGAHNWYRDHAIRYLTGYGSPHGAAALVLSVQGADVLIVEDREELERARRVSWVRDVRHSDGLADAVAKAVAGAGPVRRLGVAGGECMGFSALDVMPVSLEGALNARLPGLELVDVGKALLDLRMTRSATEIEKLRHAARIADIGAAAFLSTVREGISERDVWSEITYAMEMAGAEDVHITLCRGPGSFWPHPPSDAVLRAGDIVSVELSPRIDGYFSQANRMCFIGSPSREWCELSDMAVGALDLAADRMRAGIAAREVVAEVNAFVARSPLATMDVGGVHRIGHGCGLALDEGPFLTSASETVLTPDMTMALHPIVYLPYRHSLLMLGDYVRITETGCERLSTPQASIPVV